MPPPVKRNASVILYDVKTDSNFAVEARECLLKICSVKWFTDSKDLTKLILVNTKETNNYIYDNFQKAKHISEVTDLIGYDPKLIDGKIQNVETADGDWIMALTVAVEAIKNDLLEQKLKNIQLVFITDLSIPIEAKAKRLNFIVEKLNEMNVFLYILGPKVIVPSILKSFEDIEQWAKNIEFQDNDNPNLRSAAYIVKNANRAVICDLSLGEHLFHSYIQGWGLQPWKVPLTIGSNVTMHTDSIRFLRKCPPARWAENDSSTIQEPLKWHLGEDVLSEVPNDNVVHGVYLHEKFVPLPLDVLKDFKHNQPRCFKIIAFADRTSVYDIYMRGEGASVITSDKSRSFKLLVSVLKKENKCAIGYRVYMMGTRPKLFVLVPENENLLMSELVYGNQIRTKVVEKGINEAPPVNTDDPTVRAMYEYLNTLDITNLENQNSSPLGSLSGNLRVPQRMISITEKCLKKYTGIVVNSNFNNQVLPDVEQYRQYFPVRSEARNQN